MQRFLRLRVLVLLLVVRVGLWCATLSTLRRVLRWWARPRLRPPGPAGTAEDPAVAVRLVGTVQAIGRWVPKATCLTRALAAQALLARHGIGSRLHIGVARDKRGVLAAHAWLERDGVVILGGDELSSGYTVLPGEEWESL